MLSRIFSEDNIVVRAITTVGLIWGLNLVWLVCSLPVITLGASTTALNYAYLKMREEDRSVFSNFFQSFRENFKQATILNVISLVVIALDVWGIVFYNNYVSGVGAKLMYYVCWAVAGFVGLTMLYLYPVQSRFVNTVWKTMEYAFMLSIRHFKYTIQMILILAIEVYLATMTNLLVTFIVINFGISLTFFFFSFYYKAVFDRYIPKTEEKEVFEVPEDDASYDRLKQYMRDAELLHDKLYDNPADEEENTETDSPETKNKAESEHEELQEQKR